MSFVKAKSLLLSVVLVLSMTTPALLAGGIERSDALSNPIIRTAPPAPVFDEKTRHAELSSRRARVAQAIGPKALMVLMSAEPRVYTNDVYFEYRQENNLFYLTNLNQKGITLVLAPGNPVTPEILFMRRRSPFAEQWNGRMYSAEEAVKLSGITEIWEASELGPFLQALKNKQNYQPRPENIFMSKRAAGGTSSGFENLFEAVTGNEASLYLLAAGGPEAPEYRQEYRFSSDWKTATGFSIKSASPIFAELRLRKSPLEITLLQHAIDITNEAHQRAWLAAGNAKWEYEVDANIIYTFKLRNADHWGYPSIVGCGPNATILHYIESQGQISPGDLLLMDVGAEYQHYTADVTRTIPVSGKFTPAQAEIYQIVFDAQEAAAKASKPGATISDVDRAATEVIKDGLLRLGLITDRNSSQHRMWFMHGTSHWLGMNVHDVGSYATRLEPGMIFTNEPGIYIGPGALDNLPKNAENQKFIAAVKPAFEKYKSIGVRIEDDMLITPTGVKWMTEALPRKLSDIEDFIARGRQGR